MSHLTNGRINLGQVREATRRHLLKCLDDCPGSKAIIWDDKLTSPVGLIAEYSLLKEHDVGKMFPLINSGLPYCDEQNLIFLVCPKIETMDIIADTIKKMLQERHSKMSKKDYHIYFVPRKSVQCEIRLKELEVYSSFTNIGSFDLSLIPFDNDVLSLEHDKTFVECVLEEDLTSMYNVASSLMTLQALYGVIPKIYGKGDLAKHVCDIMLRKRKETSDVEAQTTPLIDNLVLIDRSVDTITPLLTQLTYEGLIDEHFRIENTSCQLPPEKFPPKEDSSNKQSVTADTSKQKPKKVTLNSSESLFSEIRDMNFSAVGPVLSREAKRITAEYKEHQSAKTVGEMKEFVHKLPHIQAAKQALALHTSIAEYLKEQTDSDGFRESLQVEQEFFNGIETDKAHVYIEKCIGMKEPLNKVLRLICLQCAVNNGFKLKLLDYYKREIIHTYGFQHLITISSLEKVGLLRSSQPRLYPVLRKTFRLVVDDVQEQNPNDIAYVHSGYAPLSVRLVQHLERQVGWRGVEDVMRQIPGATVETKQYVPPALLKKNTTSHQGSPKLTLVYYLGGCTYSEIAALRFLAQQENATNDYVVATTKIINGDVLIDSLSDKLEPVPVNNV